jgi:hypothetical protein
MALTGAVMALSAANTLSQASAQRRQGEYEARAYDVNAGLAAAQADDALTRGVETERQVRRGTRQFIGAQRVAGASQGVQLDTGSMADLQADAAGMGELDALTARNNAAREAFGYQSQAAQYRANATNVRRASRTAVGNTILTGATQALGYANDAGLFSRKKGSTVPTMNPDWAE